MAAGPVEIVEHRQQLADHDGFGPLAGDLLIAQRALAVVGEVGLHPLQIGGEFGDLVGQLAAPGDPRRRPLGAGPGPSTGRRS